jgi:diguanylate cyclase (GGDEF)-like protein/PAS domain S-box-containing protein
LVTDAGSNILDANEAYLQMTGYSREEVIGARPQIARSGRHGADFYRAMWDAIHREGSWSGELWNRRKDGEVYPQWLTINEIRDDHGKVTNYVGIFKDISQQKAIEERLERMAYYDPLTQLPNRVLFRDRLEHEMVLSKRSGSRLAVLFLDLDGFKYVNDTHGHDAGDKLLVEAARRIAGRLRQSDTVARLGGDEFTVILGGLSQDADIGKVADSLIESLQDVFELDDAEVHISASVGIAVYPDDGDDFVKLTKNADAAMYQAKQAGRGVYRFYTRSINESTMRRLELATALRSALERHELHLVYQPKLDLRDRRILGFEALLRWDNPRLGPVSPAEFIPVAEETGSILPIGEWVLREACGELRRWQEAGFPELNVAVNLSMRQLERGDMAQTVRDVLAQEGIDGRHVELELTETLLMRDAERAMASMKAIRASGVGLTVDDFGTGHSSLSYLKRLPIQTLKIDRSFVRDIASDPDDAAIIRAVLSMARQLRLDVVAEGVETAAQHAFLKAEGCNQAQGYFYARPLGAEAALAFLQGEYQSSGPSLRQSVN